MSAVEPPSRLMDLVAELVDCDRQERIELLIDLASGLPPLPSRLAGLKDEHRVPECASPVFLFVEAEGDRVRIHADAPVESPTVRGFVAILVEGLDGATPSQILAAPHDLVRRSGLVEILGMQRIGGLEGVWRRLRQQVDRLVMNASSPQTSDSSS
jgi:cysteine desulfuration protein SufE